jgi:hypothetical protein
LVLGADGNAKTFQECELRDRKVRRYGTTLV